jgi:hypothetical protein
MSAKEVDPVNGKYTIPGKDNKKLELTLDDIDVDKKYIVETLDGQDMDAKIPVSDLQINWFACFSIYKKDKNGKKAGYANVKYEFPVTLAEGQRFYLAYKKQIFDITDKIKEDKGKVKLSEGDPATGSVP